MSAIEEQQQVAGTEERRLWSVTELLKMAMGAGRGLVYWKQEQVAIAAVDKRRTLATMLEEGTREDAIKWLVDQQWTASERAKQRGTEVHRQAEAIALGAPQPLLEPAVAEEITPYVQQLVKWLKVWKPRFVMAEAPVYNLTHRYAGTCDGIFDIPGRGRFIFDYKTTPKGPDARSRPPYPEASLQLAAYAHAEEVGVLKDQRYTDRQQRYYIYDPVGDAEPMPHVDGALSIIVSPVDCFAVPTSIGEIPWAMFRHALELARWNDELAIQAFGASWTAG